MYRRSNRLGVLTFCEYHRTVSFWSQSRPGASPSLVSEGHLEWEGAGPWSPVWQVGPPHRRPAGQGVAWHSQSLAPAVGHNHNFRQLLTALIYCTVGICVHSIYTVYLNMYISKKVLLLRLVHEEKVLQMKGLLAPLQLCCLSFHWTEAFSLLHSGNEIQKTGWTRAIFHCWGILMELIKCHFLNLRKRYETYHGSLSAGIRNDIKNCSLPVLCTGVSSVILSFVEQEYISNTKRKRELNSLNDTWARCHEISVTHVVHLLPEWGKEIDIWISQPSLHLIQRCTAIQTWGLVCVWNAREKIMSVSVEKHWNITVDLLRMKLWF